MENKTIVRYLQLYINAWTWLTVIVIGAFLGMYLISYLPIAWLREALDYFATGVLVVLSVGMGLALVVAVRIERSKR